MFAQQGKIVHDFLEVFLRPGFSLLAHIRSPRHNPAFYHFRYLFACEKRPNRRSRHGILTPGEYSRSFHS